jgi:hypothetical protein
MHIDLPLGGDPRVILSANLAHIAREADEAARRRAYYAYQAMDARMRGKASVAAHWQRQAAVHHLAYEMAREVWLAWRAMLQEKDIRARPSPL